MIVTVADRQLDYAKGLAAELYEKGYRVEVDDRALSMQKKIAEAQVQKIPFTLVIGDREVEQKAVAPRRYGGEDLKAMPFTQFLELLAKEAAIPATKGSAKP
jgi:threonyl-tRNA synthetase